MESGTVNKPSKEEYINAHRTLDLMIHGPIESIYNTEDLIAEGELITQKKSKLSRHNRDRIQTLIQMGTTNYEKDQAAGNTECWDKLQKLINGTKELIDLTNGRTRSN